MNDPDQDLSADPFDLPDHPAPGAKPAPVGSPGAPSVTPELIGWEQAAEHTLVQGDLLAGMIPERSLSMLIGAPGSGKTAVALDLAAHIAAGAEWGGVATRMAGVAYNAADKPNAIWPRIEAIQKHKAVEPDTCQVHTGGLQFDDATSIGRFLEAIEASNKVIDLVVIDDLYAASEGLDVSKMPDASKILAGCRRITAALGASVLLVHDVMKRRDEPAGHSCLTSAPASILAIVPLAKSGRPQVLRVKPDAGRLRTRALEFRSAEIGQVGAPSVVLQMDVPEPYEPAPSPLGRNETLLLDVLVGLYERGSPVLVERLNLGAGHPDIPEGAGQVIPLRAWLSSATVAGLVPAGTSEKRKRAIFRRARLMLQNHGLVEASEAHAWLTEQPELAAVH